MTQPATYWEDRGKRSVLYKNELFYTITPIPYYVARRNVLLSLVTPYVIKSSTICDFGCGDGWYLSYFASRKSDGKWVGVDISESMLHRAELQFPDARYCNSIDQINVDVGFDLIYAFAVFAHVPDVVQVDNIWRGISERMVKGGKFIIFEQTGPVEVIGKNYVRRQSEVYVEMARKFGMVCESRKLVNFQGHQFFERYIAKVYYKYFSKGKEEYERRINANEHLLFRMLSSFFLTIGKSPVQDDTGEQWGNTLMVFTKS